MITYANIYMKPLLSFSQKQPPHHLTTVHLWSLITKPEIHQLVALVLAKAQILIS